jgi:hypothetical protein
VGKKAAHSPALATHVSLAQRTGCALGHWVATGRHSQSCVSQVMSGQRKGRAVGHVRGGGQSAGLTRHVSSTHLNGASALQVMGCPHEFSLSYEPSGQGVRPAGMVLSAAAGHWLMAARQVRSWQRTGVAAGHTWPCGQSADEAAQTLPALERGQSTSPSGHEAGALLPHDERHEPSSQRSSPEGQVVCDGHSASVAAHSPPGQRSAPAGQVSVDVLRSV